MMDVYRRSHITGMVFHPKYVMETEGVDILNSKESFLCSLEYINVNEINRLLTASQELLIAPLESFLDLLEEWGCTGLWDKMQLTGGTDWLEEAIS